VQSVDTVDLMNDTFTSKAIESMAKKEVPVLDEFSTKKYPLGKANTYVNARGYLAAKLELISQNMAHIKKPRYAAAGFTVKAFQKRPEGKGVIFDECELLCIGLCEKHADPTIPSIGSDNGNR